MKRLVILALVGALLAGCGSETDANNTYVKQLNAAQTAFATAASSVAQPGPGQSSTRQYRTTLRSYEKAIDAAIGRLRAMEVPEAVRTEHEQFIQAMTRFGSDIEKAGATLRDPTPRTLAAVPGQMQRAAQTVNERITAASSAINTKLGVS